MSPSPARRDARDPRRPAFTIVELLVVIGVLALVASIVLPVVSTARARAREVVCQSNQRQIAGAFMAFATEHRGQLPGNWWDHADPDKEHRAWLLNYGEPIAKAPQGGTVFKYLNNEAVYRCPEVEQYAATGSGMGSNGRFDYAAFLVFAGARLASIAPRDARFTHPDGRVMDGLPVPLICEEEPIGGVNGGNNEGGHCNTDRIAHHHRGGGFYASVDSSVHYFREPMNANSWNWTVRTSRNPAVSLGNVPNPTWGWWNRQ